MEDFRFKQFGVSHCRSTMKVGTDGVLSGAWCSLPEGGNILDLGCGCGLIALMLAQRMTEKGSDSFRIFALDIDGDSVSEAEENFFRSPWSAHLKAVSGDFRKLPDDNFPPESLSLIVSNPPFFTRALKSPEAGRNLSRHTDTLPFELLFRNAEKLLCESGELSMILPADVFETLRKPAANLFLKRFTRVYAKPGKPCERVLACWVRKALETPVESELCLVDTQGNYTDSYRDMVKAFYLWA